MIRHGGSLPSAPRKRAGLASEVCAARPAEISAFTAVTSVRSRPADPLRVTGRVRAVGDQLVLSADPAAFERLDGGR